MTDMSREKAFDDSYLMTWEDDADRAQDFLQEHMETIRAALQADKAGDVESLRREVSCWLVSQYQEKITFEMAIVAEKVFDYLVSRNLLSPNNCEDLTKCPKCGGPADNGHDRCHPPNPYYCTKCEASENIGDWQPIETAPKDGTRILLWGDLPDWDGCFYEVGYWDESIGGFTCDVEPTHWQPLPKPPAIQQALGKIEEK